MPLNMFRIPDPVAPADHYRESRDFYRTMAKQGAPGGAERREQFAQAVYTPANLPTTANPEAAIVGGGVMDAGRAKAAAEFSSREGEQDARFRAEAGEALGRIDSERSQDMEQYRNLMASAEASRGVMRANLFTGVLRAGVGLATAGVGASLVPDVPDVADPQPNNPIGLGKMGFDAASGFTPSYMKDNTPSFSASHLMDRNRGGFGGVPSPTEQFGIEPPANYVNRFLGTRNVAPRFSPQ